MTKWATLFSCASDEWSTPNDVFDALDAELGPFTLDAAAAPETARAPVFFSAENDALVQPWHGKVWCNPPYSIARKFLDKAQQELDAGRCSVVCMLLPARTDTAWFHEVVLARRHRVRFARGRLRFGGAKSGAPFPSIVVVMRRPRVRRVRVSPGDQLDWTMMGQDRPAASSTRCGVHAARELVDNPRMG